MRYDFWQSKQNIHFGGSNLNCISLASSVESFALATSISVYSIDHSQTQLHHYFAVDVSAVSSLCCCPKNAESLLCFDVTLHSCRSCPFLSKFTMIISIIINTLQKNNNFCVMQDNKKTSSLLAEVSHVASEV